MSQGHGGAGVFELAGQHSSIELVELHQVDQVSELGGAVVQAEEHLAVLLTLRVGATVSHNQVNRRVDKFYLKQLYFIKLTT